MIVPLIVIALGQFDFGSGQAPPKGFRLEPTVLGQEVLAWDVVCMELGLDMSGGFSRELRKLPIREGPDLKAELWKCGVIVPPPRADKLPPKGKARLGQLYVQFAGSASALNPQIAATLRLTAAQRQLLNAVAKESGPSYFTRQLLATAHSGNYADTVDGRIQSHLKATDYLRRIELAQLEFRAAIRAKCRSILTSPQLKTLDGMQGKPLGASLHQTFPSIRGAFGPIDGKGFRQGLQVDGAFSILRHDVARQLGVTEPQMDRMMIDLQRLSIRANQDADEYWWLLKREGSTSQIQKFRRTVFDRYEAEARKMIRESLTARQQSLWDQLAGPPISGTTARGHFG